MKKNQIGKYAGILLCTALLLSGCGDSATKETTPAAVPEQTSSEEMTTSSADSETTAAQPEAVKSDEVVLYIARHGKTMLNTVDRSQGWIDAPLTPAGVEIAEALGRGLKAEGIEFDRVYSSDSGRAIETAELVLQNKGQELEIHKDKRLREINFGTYEGMMNEEMWGHVAEAQGKTLEELMNDLDETGFTKFIEGFANSLAELDRKNTEEGINWPAEDIETVQQRLTEAYDAIVKESMENGATNVLVVSHGMSICTYLGMLDENADIPSKGLKNASVSKVIYKDGIYTIETIDDLSFVEKGTE